MSKAFDSASTSLLPAPRRFPAIIYGRSCDPGFWTPDGEIVDEAVVFRWRRQPGRLRVMMQAPTAGWLAASFNSRPEQEGARVIVGYVSGLPVIAEERQIWRRRDVNVRILGLDVGLDF